MNNNSRTYRKKRSIPSLSSTSVKAMWIGTYAVICHLCFIFFHYTLSDPLPPEIFTDTYLPMVKASLYAFVIVIIGSLLLDLTIKETKEYK